MSDKNLWFLDKTFKKSLENIIYFLKPLFGLKNINDGGISLRHLRKNLKSKNRLKLSNFERQQIAKVYIFHYIIGIVSGDSLVYILSIDNDYCEVTSFGKYRIDPIKSNISSTHFSVYFNNFNICSHVNKCCNSNFSSIKCQIEKIIDDCHKNIFDKKFFLKDKVLKEDIMSKDVALRNRHSIWMTLIFSRLYMCMQENMQENIMCDYMLEKNPEDDEDY